MHRRDGVDLSKPMRVCTHGQRVRVFSEPFATPERHLSTLAGELKDSGSFRSVLIFSVMLFGIFTSFSTLRVPVRVFNTSRPLMPSVLCMSHFASRVSWLQYPGPSYVLVPSVAHSSHFSVVRHIQPICWPSRRIRCAAGFPLW